MKQDRNGVRTAQDLERKYNLSSISLIKKAVEQTETGLTKVNAELENFANATLNTIEDLQNQIDGNITTYYYSGVPTLSNLPVSSWSQSEYNVHIGDLYYDKNTGYAYRFYLDSTTNQYGWVKLTDNDVVQALAIANAASDTADSKRRVFTETPTPPYDNGDLWINNQEIYICQISKDSTQQYSSNDFIVATKYTDNTLANQVNERLTVVSGRVATVEQGVDELSTQIEENRYYIDGSGNRVLISEQVNRVTSNVNGITQRINNLTIFIREATNDERVFIENASAHTVMHLSITGKFELLYPEDGLYPEDNLSPLEPYLVVETVPEEGEELQRKIYNLPIDKIETGDIFEIDLEGNCTLTKQDDSIIDLGILNVELFEGDNYLYIPSYHPELLTYNVSYVIKNEYTSVFATRVEMNSAITQTADEINLEVSKKVDENDVVSTINQSAEKIELKANRLVIDSDYFKLSEDGKMEAVDGKFSGDINTDSNVVVGNDLYVGQNQSSDTIDKKYIYFSNDSYIQRIRQASTNTDVIKINADYIAIQKDSHRTASFSDSNISLESTNIFNIYSDGFVNIMGGFKWINFDSSGITASTQITVASDERLKDNIKNISVDWINDLKVKEFEYKDDNGRKQIGLIAQEYLDKDYSKYFLNDFDLKGEKYYGISYGNITNALIQYCQEMNEKINKLEKRIEELESDK